MGQLIALPDINRNKPESSDEKTYLGRNRVDSRTEKQAAEKPNDSINNAVKGIKLTQHWIIRITAIFTLIFFLLLFTITNPITRVKEWLKLSPPQIQGISCTLASIDFPQIVKVSNMSGRDLHEVKLTITLTNDNGMESSESKYFAVWGQQQEKIVDFFSGGTIQKIYITGQCDEGYIDLNLTY